MAYFSEREHGPQPRTGQTLTDTFAKGIPAAIAGHVANGWFGASYPARCVDEGVFRGVFGTNTGLFADALTGTLNIPWPIPHGEKLDDLLLLDVIEFAWKKIALPNQEDFTSSTVITI
jgi:hypothetical protein